MDQLVRVIRQLALINVLVTYHPSCAQRGARSIIASLVTNWSVWAATRLTCYRLHPVVVLKVIVFLLVWYELAMPEDEILLTNTTLFGKFAVSPEITATGL